MTDFRKQKMVGWYNVKQLVATGLRTLISSTFGSYADKREVQAALNEARPHDFSQHTKGEFWFDYMSDCGDGFDATFTMARLVASPLATEAGMLPRGQLLVLGGDQVYPTPNRENYNDRFKGPFSAAFPHQANNLDRPGLFAIPGNHDWYDGLNSFLKIFCQQRGVGHWQTHQTRSYFAIKLPHRCWLWGIDIQLEADIDQPQLKFFKEIAAAHPGDNIILMTAEPSWVFKSRLNDSSYNNLRFFKEIIENQGAGMRILTTFAGDLHHYSRYSAVNDPEASHLITSGGGGAFLHPTHNLKKKLENLKEGDHILQKTYPDKEISRLLTFRNLLFPFINYEFAVFMGFLYLFVAWLVQSASLLSLSLMAEKQTFLTITGALEPSLRNAMAILKAFSHIAIYSPAIIIIFFGLIAGSRAFTDVHFGNTRILRAVGIVHGAAHIFLNIITVWLFSYFAHHISLHPAWMLISFSLGVLVAGGFLGSMLMGVYLLICNLFFGIHDNEAFSSLQIKDYKNFLRCCIDDKALTIYAIGVDKVGRWSRAGADLAGPLPKIKIIEVVKVPLESIDQKR